jgi:hypothetical protein
MENVNNPDVGWMKPALIFARTLTNILEENQGVITYVNENTIIEGHETVDKLIVYKKEGQIHIAPCEEDIPEGVIVSLAPPSEEAEQ